MKKTGLSRYQWLIALGIAAVAAWGMLMIEIIGGRHQFGPPAVLFDVLGVIAVACVVFAVAQLLRRRRR